MNINWHYINPSKLQQKAFIKSFNGSLRDEFLNEETFDTLDETRLNIPLWRYDYNNVKPHSSPNNRTFAETRHALELEKLKALQPPQLTPILKPRIKPSDSRYE